MGIFSEAKYRYRFRYYNLSIKQAVGLIIPTLIALKWECVNVEIDKNTNCTKVLAKTFFTWKSWAEYVVITVEDSNHIFVYSKCGHDGIAQGKNKQNCLNFEKIFNDISKEYSKDTLEVLFDALKEEKEDSEMIEI